MVRKLLVVLTLFSLSLQTCWAFGEFFHVHGQSVVQDDGAHHHAGHDHHHGGPALVDDAPVPLDTLDHHHSCASHSPSAIPPSLALLKFSVSDAPQRLSSPFKLLLLSQRFERPNWSRPL